MEIKQITTKEAQKKVSSLGSKYHEAYIAILNAEESLEITFDNAKDAVNFSHGLYSKINRVADFPKCKASVRREVVTILILKK